MHSICYGFKHNAHFLTLHTIHGYTHYLWTEKYVAKMWGLTFQCSLVWIEIIKILGAVLDIPHIGSFAQNSFQIDSINSCSTSKKLLFWLKIVKIIQFLTLKPIKGTLGIILKMLKKIARWRHKSEISKRNVKTMIYPLLFRL